MTQFLIRRFIRHPNDPQDPATRTAYGNLASGVGMACNLLLCLGKLLAGTLFGSIAIMADALNNLSDASSNVVSLIGFRLAAKAPDAEHPYGHARYEYLAGLVVSVTILGIGFSLLKESVVKVFHPTPVAFSWLSVGVLAASILVKLWMSGFNRTIGRTIGSETLMATAADSRNDVLTTGAVLVSTVVCSLTGWARLDGIMGVAVAAFILWSGWGLVMDTLSPLLGESPSPELVEHIEQTVMGYPGVLGMHDLMVHDYGPGRRFASVHAEIDHRIDPLIAHEILDEIERQAKRELHVDLVIHYDPIVTDDPEIAAVRTRVLQIMHGLDPRLSLHDFRMVSGSHHVNVIFDMVIPPEDAQTAEQLRRQIEAQLQDGKKTYHLIVTFDTAAFNELSTEAGEQQSR
jgi:cation diffusion facilitator family transporter